MTRERDWEKLGKAFAAARKTIGLTQPEAADQLDVSRTTVQAIERGRQSNGAPFDKVTATMRAYARLVGWTETSPALVLEGGEPQLAPDPQAADQPPSDLPPAVDRELRSGKTLDTTVVHLGSEDDDTRIIVVLKGGDSMTEEEIDEAWQKWRRTRRHLQAIPGESDTSPEA
ncbi:helix-turn-helix domain-containing protein [Streptomyces nigra]|jgi:DNA-binding XRE family transcriptional regulator|uniref:helix-turn-helix domain-containing protein n=1 Tax=Streptomyces nigra TaxID=1827580 RepID=UPI0036BCFF8E